MVPGKVKDIPSRAYIASARSHLASAKVLVRAGHHDHASFHLITAMEELSRAYTEVAAQSGVFKGLKWDGKPVLGQLSGTRKDHDFKIPGGMLLVALRARKLYDVEIQLLSPSCPPAARAKLGEKLARDIEWLAHLFGTTDGVRELSIYAGWDGKDIPRPVVDWQRAAEILTPILDRELRFQEFLLEHPLGPKELDEVRTEFIALAKKKGGPAK